MDPAPATEGAESTPAQALREVAFLRNLGDAQLAELVATGQRCSVPAGQVVVNEGDLADRLYVILGELPRLPSGPGGRRGRDSGHRAG